MPTALSEGAKAPRKQGAASPRQLVFDANDFAQGFRAWLDDLVSADCPDLIVAIARGAVRLIQIVFPELPNRIPVISHQGIPFMPTEALANKRVLLVDDSVIFGSTLDAVYRYLLERGALVTCAAYALDRSNFLGEPVCGTVARPQRSPFADIPLRTCRQLSPLEIRRHHASIVRNVAANPIDYNPDFPTFSLQAPDLSADETSFAIGLIYQHPDVDSVVDVTSPWSAKSQVFRYTVFLKWECLSPFVSSPVTIRRLTKLRLLIAPRQGLVRLTPIVQLQAPISTTLADVHFRDVSIALHWTRVALPISVADRYYARSALRLLTCVVSALLARDAANIVRNSLSRFFKIVDRAADPFDLNSIVGMHNGEVIRRLCAEIPADFSLLDRTAPASHDSPEDEIDDPETRAAVQHSMKSHPRFAVSATDSLSEAIGKIFLALREATDSPQRRQKSPSQERLAVGLTPGDLRALLPRRHFTGRELSAALDLCVDNGLAVPKYVERNDQTFRAFYCGEDEDDQGTQQFRACLHTAYVEYMGSRPKAPLSPYDFHKLCSFLKEVLPWIPLTVRFENFGRTAYVDGHLLTDWLTADATGALTRERTKSGKTVLLPSADFQSPVLAPTWQESDVRNLLDGFEFIANAFAKRYVSSAAKLLVSTCPTHLHAYNAVAFEVNAWCTDSMRSLGQALDGIARIAQASGTPKPGQLEPLFWCIQYVNEAAKKHRVFYQKFADSRAQLDKAFRSQGKAAARWWRLTGSRHLNPDRIPHVHDRFEAVRRLFPLMLHLTAYAIGTLRAVGPDVEPALREAFRNHGVDFSHRENRWVADSSQTAAAPAYNRALKRVSASDCFLKSELKETDILSVPAGERRRNAALIAIEGASTCFREVRSAAAVHVKEYEVSDGQFPFLPNSDRRRCADGSTEQIFRESFFFVADVIGSTDSERSKLFIEHVLHTFAKFEQMSPKHFFWEHESGDRFKACARDFRLLCALARSLANDAMVFRTESDTFDGTRKAIAFGDFAVRSAAVTGMRIVDAQSPQIIPKATSLLDAVDRHYNGAKRDEVIVLAPEAMRAATGAAAIATNEDILQRDIKEKHYRGPCFFIGVPRLL